MENQRILIIRLSSMGDIIQCLGVSRLLKKKFPDLSIDWVVRSDLKHLVETSPYVTHTIAFDRRLGFSGWLRLCQSLQKENYSHVYDAHNNLRSHLLCLFLKPKFFVRRSKERIKRVFLFVFKMKFLQKFNNGIDTYIEPLKVWGLENDFLGSEFFVKPENLQAAQKILASLETHGNPIALAPATAHKNKSWPEDFWIKLVKLFLEKTKESLLVLGGPDDHFCQNLILDKKRVISLQGRLNIMETAGALTFCKTLVAADTGLLHMAESLGKNVVGLWGPTHLGHTYRSQSITLEKPLWCRPCSKDGSAPCIHWNHQKCMTEISPEEVFEATRKVLLT